MNRDQKVQAVAEIEELYKSNSAVYVTHYHGLTVSEMNDLRKNLRDNDAGFKVVKNTLAKIAAKNTGYEGVDDLFSGPVGVVYSSDPVSAAKALTKFAKDHEVLKLVGGIMDNNRIDESTIVQLSKLPTMDELRGKLVGILQAPAGKIASVLNAPASQLARVVSAYSTKK